MIPILILELKALIPHNVRFSGADTYSVVLASVTLKLHQSFVAGLSWERRERTLPQVVIHPNFVQGEMGKLELLKVTSAQNSVP